MNQSLVTPKPLEEINPFYTTCNQDYGSAWQSAANQGFGALNNDDVPLYKQVVSRDSSATNLNTGRS